MIDILAISGASATAINRNVYVALKNMGWKIEMLIPEAFPVASNIFKKADPPRNFDPVIHFLPLTGINPRMFHYPQLNQLLNRLKPSVILLENDPVSQLAIDAGKWCRENNASLLCLSCENLSFDILPTIRRKGIKSFPAAIMKSYLNWKARPYVDTVFTINDDGTALFRAKHYHNVNKIPLGFDPAVFFRNPEARDSIRRKLGLTHPAFAYFGRLVPEKGVHLLIEALKSLKSFQWHFMLDKFDLYANAYNQQISDLIQEAGIADRVIYIEADHYEIASYMNAADVVIVPSISAPHWKEQYGRVAPEAMATGKVVIAANSGALPELLADAGLIFEEGDVEGLARHLSAYLANPGKFITLGERAEKRAHDLLSIPTQAAQYDKRIKEVLARRGRKRLGITA
jgi:glycosyltransferase involved in cell wall biosynthesis